MNQGGKSPRQTSNWWSAESERSDWLTSSPRKLQKKKNAAAQRPADSASSSKKAG